MKSHVIDLLKFGIEKVWKMILKTCGNPEQIKLTLNLESCTCDK